jgi:replication factor A1
VDQIKNLTAKQTDVNVQGTIKEVSPPREFQKYGKPGRVANSILEDESGQIVLTLWNEDVDNIKAGDKIKVVNGYVNEWRGDLQLTAGRKGSLEKISDEETNE